MNVKKVAEIYGFPEGELAEELLIAQTFHDFWSNGKSKRDELIKLIKAFERVGIVWSKLSPDAKMMLAIGFTNREVSGLFGLSPSTPEDAALRLEEIITQFVKQMHALARNSADLSNTLIGKGGRTKQLIGLHAVVKSLRTVWERSRKEWMSLGINEQGKVTNESGQFVLDCIKVMGLRYSPIQCHTAISNAIRSPETSDEYVCESEDIEPTNEELTNFRMQHWKR